MGRRAGRLGGRDTCAYLLTLRVPQEAGAPQDAEQLAAGRRGSREYDRQRQHRHRGLLADRTEAERLCNCEGMLRFYCTLHIRCTRISKMQLNKIITEGSLLVGYASGATTRGRQNAARRWRMEAEEGRFRPLRPLPKWPMQLHGAVQDEAAKDRRQDVADVAEPHADTIS